MEMPAAAGYRDARSFKFGVGESPLSASLSLARARLFQGPVKRPLLLRS